MIDTDNSGTIDPFEMKLALKGLGIFNEKELYSIRNYFKVDHKDSELSYDEFLKLILQAQKIYE